MSLLCYATILFAFSIQNLQPNKLKELFAQEDNDNLPTSRIIDLSKYTNGEDVKNEYLIDYPDNVSIKELEEVTWEQYELATLNRSYKYLYMLSIYYERTLGNRYDKSKIIKMINSIVNEGKGISSSLAANYIENAGVENVCKKLVADLQNVKDIDSFHHILLKFQKSVLSLFAINYENSGENETIIREKLDNDIESGVFFSTIVDDDMVKSGYWPIKNELNTYDFYNALRSVVSKLMKEYPKSSAAP